MNSSEYGSLLEETLTILLTDNKEYYKKLAVTENMLKGLTCLLYLIRKSLPYPSHIRDSVLLKIYFKNAKSRSLEEFDITSYLMRAKVSPIVEIFNEINIKTPKINYSEKCFLLRYSCLMQWLNTSILVQFSTLDFLKGLKYVFEYYKENFTDHVFNIFEKLDDGTFQPLQINFT